jgi:hypothetical protein
MGERMILPDLNFTSAKWRTGCVARFITDNLNRFEHRNEINQYLDDAGGVIMVVGSIFYKIRSDELKMRGSMPLTV